MQECKACSESKGPWASTYRICTSGTQECPLYSQSFMYARILMPLCTTPGDTCRSHAPHPRPLSVMRAITNPLLRLRGNVCAYKWYARVLVCTQYCCSHVCVLTCQCYYASLSQAHAIVMRQPTRLVAMADAVSTHSHDQ